MSFMITTFKAIHTNDTGFINTTVITLDDGITSSNYLGAYLFGDFFRGGCGEVLGEGGEGCDVG